MGHALWDQQVLTIDGQEKNLRDLEGKVVLIVNTASACGFTPQFKGLEELHKKYGEQGLVVMGFPCNQFGAQDPGSNDEILTFCTTNYNVSFPMHAKIEVNGAGTHPLYEHLKNEAPGLMGTKKIKWNFTKFLVNKQGKVVKRFAPTTKPKDIEAEIEKLLSN